MKYIIFTDGSAVIFGDTTSHKAVAGNRPVSSAGFCRVETFRNDYDDVRAKVSAWGKAILLMLIVVLEITWYLK